MWYAVGRHPVDPALRHGLSFFKGIAHLVQGSPDGRLRALHTQHRTELDKCGIRVSLHQFAQTNTVDLRVSNSWFRWPGRDFTVLTTTLLHTPHPRRAHAEDICNLFRFHCAITRRDHAITKILRVRNWHPSSCPAQSIEPDRNLHQSSEKRNPNKRLTRYRERQTALNGNFGRITLAFDSPQSWFGADYAFGLSIWFFEDDELVLVASFDGQGGGNFGGIISDEPFDSLLLTGDPLGCCPFIDDLYFGVPGPGGLAVFIVAGVCIRRRTRSVK